MRKYRAVPLSNIKTGEMDVAYLIQIKHGGKWWNCMDDSGAMVYKTKLEAESQIANLTAIHDKEERRGE